jgi:hypothetical protein
MKTYLKYQNRMIKRMRALEFVPLLLGALCGLPGQSAAADQIGIGEEGQTVVTVQDYFCPFNGDEAHFVVNLDGDHLDAYFVPAASGWTSYITPIHEAFRKISRNDKSRHRELYRIRFDPMGAGDPQPVNQQYVVDGHTGPGYIGVDWDYRHRLVFWVDFRQTPEEPEDDQRFDGYIMTQTENALAGITWKKGIPVPFTLSFHHCPH